MTAKHLVDVLLETRTFFKITNRHNGKQYAAVGMHWPEYGWSFQIMEPGAWGRHPSGIGPGPVIDQGFQKDLEQRGWQFPTMEKPVDIRNQTMRQLAADMFARDNPPNPS